MLSSCQSQRSWPGGHGRGLCPPAAHGRRSSGVAVRLWTWHKVYSSFIEAKVPMERPASKAGAQRLQGRGRRCFEVMNSLLSAGSWFQKPPELLRRPKSGGTCEKQTQIFSLAQRNAPDSASHSLPSLTPSTLPGFPVLHLRHGLLPGFCHFARLPQTQCLSSADFGFLCRLLPLTCLYLHLLRPGHRLRNQAPGPGLQPS